jgi:DNA-binding transcriptional LysR family regulator
MHPSPLPHLDTFLHAAELGSFSAAARLLGVTQAAVSQRIQALEKALNASLFRRQAGRVVLTEAGRLLHDYARRIFELQREAVAAVAGCPVTVTGELTLAASSVPGEHLLPELLARFRQRHPQIQVRATVLDSQAVLRQVETGTAQLGLVGSRGGGPHLEYRPFGRDRLALVVPAGHAWARRRQVATAELAEQPLIVREAGSSSRGCLEAALARAGRSLAELRVVLELGSNEAIKEALTRGLGLAFLSTRVVEREVAEGRLFALGVRGLTLERDLFVCWDRRRPLPIPARLFLDLLAKPAEQGS